MILYRALINDDLKELNEKGEINCTLYRSYNDLENCKNINRTKSIYKLCYIEAKKDVLLSLIYGHVNGKLVSSAKRSPWISLTSSFNAAYKYANLEKCIETIDKRYIICFEVDDNMIINNNIDFELKDITDGAIVNLSNGELAQYRRDGIIIPFGETKEKERTGSNFMFDKYSKTDKEYLICYKLEPINYILLSPNEQKELINSDMDINEQIKNMLNHNQKKLSKIKIG